MGGSGAVRGPGAGSACFFGAPAMIGACCFFGYHGTRLRVDGNATSVREVNVPEYRAVGLLSQPAVVNGVAGACGKGRLLGLLLRYSSLSRERRLVGGASTRASRV